MKIFLHIGKARTSTTALQNGAARQRDTLRKAGLCYPATAPPTMRATCRCSGPPPPRIWKS